MYHYAVLFSILMASSAYHKPGYPEVDIQRYATVSNHLGYKLQMAQSYQPGNQLISPYGISAMLGALYHAAEGKTEQEIGQIGYKDLEQRGIDIAESHQKLAKSLQQSSEERVLQEATAMVYQSDYSVSKKYQDTMESVYGALLVEVDKWEGSEQIENKVNRWVQEQTNGKISHIVRNIEVTSGMALLNAIYFQGELKTQTYQCHTVRRPFFNEDGSKSQSVKYHQAQSSYPYFEDEQLEAVQLPYGDEEYRLLVILPKEQEGIQQLQQQVSPITLQRIKDKSQKCQVRVTIPQLNLENSQNLQQDIRSLGITSLFRQEAEFSEVSPSREAYISQMAQRCMMKFGQFQTCSEEEYGIRLSEEENIVNRRIGAVEFRADRPFLFFVVHERTGLNLLAGRVSHL